MNQSTNDPNKDQQSQTQSSGDNKNTGIKGGQDSTSDEDEMKT